VAGFSARLGYCPHCIYICRLCPMSLGQNCHQSAIAREHGFKISTANTIVKDATCIEDRVKRTAKMKSTVTKKHESVICETKT
jgi:hypothetical protein